MGRLSRAAAVLLLAAAVAPVFGCASASGDGFYYVVRPGDNVYRIGQRFGVPTRTLVRLNHIRDVRSLKVGSKLWIPGSGVAVASSRSTAPARGAQNPTRGHARAGTLELRWPLHGTLTSRFGRRNGRAHQGIDVSARRGSTIRAAAAGKVIHSGRLGDYGKVVILKHAGSVRTVYAHASRLTVDRGDFVERGQKIAEVGSTGNASGPHLHFEVRIHQRPQDPMLYLP